MATTTNYSWSTPDDTALVKDGAAAIRSLGTAIDTTVFTNAGAAIAKATVDAKGDLIAGTADNTVARLAVGANDTILVADSSTATGLKWAAPSSTIQTATFNDTKTAGTAGGTFTNGAWRTRDLNTTQQNSITGCSLSSNQITLGAGTYTVSGGAVASQTGPHNTRIYNITGSAVLVTGLTGVCDEFATTQTVSNFGGTFTLTGSTVIEVQHRASSTFATSGFGKSQAWDSNIYTFITITKVA
jgi:hypothetical protein